VLEIERLLKDLNISSKGIERGGLSITHDGPPGALIARGVVVNKERHFACNLNFVDPAGQKNSILNGTGLMLARPAAGSFFPESSFFTPQLTLKNASTSSHTATVTVTYTANGRAESKKLPTLSLAPHEVRAVDFTHFVAGLRNVSVSSAGLEIRSSGAPGTLIGALSSMDRSGSTVVDVPLVSRSERSGEGGNHPFLIDESYQSVAYLTNITETPTKVLVAVFYPGGMFTPELMAVGPGETIAVDVLKWRDSQIKDVQNRTLPPDLTEGQVFWKPHEGEALIGRIVMLDKTDGTTSNFSCPNCCTYEPTRWVGSPDPFSGPVGGSQQMTLYQYETLCGCCEMGPYQVSSVVSIYSDDTSIATVNSSAMVSFVGPGNANIVWAITYFHSDFISAEDCGNVPVDNNVPCPVTAKPHVSSISPARGVREAEYGVTITGAGFMAPASVSVAGPGISVSEVVVGSSTEMLATFTIASGATAGDHAVTVTANGQTSDNSVNFFVQIPTKLRRDNISSLQDEPGGCGATKNLDYSLLDQAGQVVAEDLTVHEVFSNFTSNPAGFPPPQDQSPVANAGHLVDVVGYRIPTCPPPFTVTVTQTFTVTVGQTVYNVTTTNSFSYGRDASGNKFVTVTNTIP
jgi:hypothetical protein